MSSSRRIILITLNLLAIVVALSFIGYFTIKPGTASPAASSEQISAQVVGISDPARLRSIIVRDDEYIRSLEALVNQTKAASRGVLASMSVFATLGLIVLILPQNPPSTSRKPSNS